MRVSLAREWRSEDWDDDPCGEMELVGIVGALRSQKDRRTRRQAGDER